MGTDATTMTLVGAGLAAGGLCAGIAWWAAGRRTPAREDRASGLPLVPAARGDWQDICERARAADHASGLVVIRFAPRNADAGACALAGLEPAPRAWRTDYDEVCVACEAVQASGLVDFAGGLMARLAGVGSRPDLAGLAAAPFDGMEFDEVVEAARSRLVPADRLSSAAERLAAAT